MAKINDEEDICGECNSSIERKVCYDHKTYYGEERLCWFTVDMPYYSCKGCEFEWTNWVGEDIAEERRKQYLEMRGC